MKDTELKRFTRQKLKDLGTIRASRYYSLEEVTANMLPIVEDTIWSVLTSIFDENELQDIEARMIERTEWLEKEKDIVD